MVGFGLLLNLSLAITLLSIVVICLLPSRYKGPFAAFTIFINAIATSWFAFPALIGNTIDASFNLGNILGEVLIRIDGLSAWFIIIINFTSITGVFYGIGYLKEYNSARPKLSLHWALFIIFHLSMILVCIIQHSIAFLMTWEIMSLSSMLLVIFDHHKPKTLKAGINYLVQMHISLIFLTIGFLWVYSQSGTFNLDGFHTFFNTNSNIWLFLIFFIGFGLKAGFIPLHSWLPHAHPAAPSHVSGVMSGVIVKLGIYGIIRIITYLKSDYLILGEIVLLVSILTGIYGILNATVQRDFKKMLAYCTIENIGIIGIGIGIGLIGLGNNSAIMYYLGFGGALLHVLNHSLFKSLLFFSAGSVYQQTHTRDIEKLGGLIKQMPKTAAIFLIGAIALGGIPPFNGFISEFIIYSGLIEGIKLNSLNQISIMIFVIAGLSFVGGLSIIAFTKSFGTIFLGIEREKKEHQPNEVSYIMLLPQYIIIAVMLSIAFLPQLYLNAINYLLQGMGSSFSNIEPSGFLDFSSILFNISIYSALLLAIITVFFVLRYFVARNKIKDSQTTWGCSYVSPNNRMQYSGKSFTKTLGRLLNFILIERKQYEELKSNEIFPKQRKYKSYYLDFFEHRVINPITRRLVHTADYFTFIQNGRIQSYVLYGIIVIVVVFLLTILKIV